MLKNSRSELHEFLFHLRTPLASIRGAAQMAKQAERLDIPFPPEAHTWIAKWRPKIDTWLEEVTALSALCGGAKPEDHDWKKMIQDLIASLDGVEVAAKEASNIPLSSKEGPGDLVHMIVKSINYINDRYRAMQELLPTLT